MKPTFALRSLLCIAASAAISISYSQAAILTWDAGGGGGAITNGGGAWLGAGLWNDATVAATWTSGDDAIFAGPATNGGAVTLAGPTTVNSLTFSPSYNSLYTLGTAGQAITLNNGITMNASAGPATIISPLILGGVQSWTNNSLNNASSTTGSLNINSTLNLNGNALTIGGSGLTSFGGAAAAVISGAGGINVTGGRLWLGAGQAPAHTYSGDTTLTGGAVVMYSANLSANSNINLNGGVIESYWTGGLSRTIGTGATQIRITGGESGFGMNGSNGSTFTLGALTWGDTNFNPTKLLLQTQYSQGTSALVLASAIDLNGADRTVVAHQGLAGTASSTISGNITNGTGTASLIKEGLGLLTLTGASNTYNGGTTISAGTLAFDKIAAMPSTGVVAVNNATLGIDVGAAGDWTGSSTVVVGTLGGVLGGLGGAGTSTVTYTGNVGLRLNLTGNTTYSGDIANVGTTLALTKVGTSTLTLSGTNNSYSGATRIEVGQLTLDGSLTGGGAISTSGTATFFQSGTGVISGASSYTQSSTGSSTLSGNNSYTGGTTLSAGTLALGHDSALGSGTVALNGTTIQSTNATARTFANAVTIGNNFTVGGTGNLTFSNTGASALGAARTITVTTSGVNATFAQGFSGAFAINKAGAGTLTLSGTNTNLVAGTSPTYTNTGGGVLIFSKPAALTGIMQVSTGNTGTYRIQSDADLSTGTSGIQSFGTGILNLQVDRQTAGSGTGLDFNFTNGTAGAIDLATLATVNFSTGPNITSGTPTIDITSANGLRSQSANSGTNIITITASGVNVRANGLTAGSSGRTKNWHLGGTSTGNEIYGNITDGGNNFSVTKNGTGTWTLSGTNTYDSATTVTGGILNTTKAVALSAYNAAGRVVINGGTLGVRVGGAGWTTTEVDTMLTNATKTSGAIGIDTTNGNLTQWTPFAGAGNFGALGLSKLGSNTLTLDQANTYTGATNVNAGTLKLGANNVLPDTNVTIGSATLDADTFDDTLGTLDAAGSAVINLGAGANLIFADSSAVDWTGGSLNITGTFVSGSSLNFGVGGLSLAQLAAITINGVPGSYTIDGSGFLSSGGGSPYDTWATSKGLTGLPGSATDPAKNADPDNDGRNNIGEFAFNGDPLSGSDNGKVYVLTEDSDFEDDPSSAKELILTIAVRTGTAAFAGSPSPSAIQAADGITYSIEGSLDLASFPTTVNVVSPVTTGLPLDPGMGYVYRSFSLDGSDGLAGKGFLRAKVTSP